MSAIVLANSAKDNANADEGDEFSENVSGTHVSGADLSKKPRKSRTVNGVVDTVLTHPATEALKTALRVMFDAAERKMANLAATYAAAVDLHQQSVKSPVGRNLGVQAYDESSEKQILVSSDKNVNSIEPKTEERGKNNSRLTEQKLKASLSARAQRIHEVMKAVQVQVDSYRAAPESVKVAKAELVASSMQRLQRALDETLRDMQVDLGMLAVNGISTANEKLQSVESKLTGQQEMMQQQTRDTACVLEAVAQLVSSVPGYLAAAMTHATVPGYARVANPEVRQMWHDFFRWPAVLPVADFVEQISVYFEMTGDRQAYEYCQRAHPTGELESVIQRALGVPVDINTQSIVKVTALKISDAIPASSSDSITIADWLLWCAHGWMMVAREASSRIAAICSTFVVCEELVKNFSKSVEVAIEAVCETQGYLDADLHTRLLLVSARITDPTKATSSALETAPEHGSEFLEILGDAYDVLHGAKEYFSKTLCPATPIENNVTRKEQEKEIVLKDGTMAFVQALATLQWRLGASCAYEQAVKTGGSHPVLMWSNEDVTKAIDSAQESAIKLNSAKPTKRKSTNDACGTSDSANISADDAAVQIGDEYLARGDLRQALSAYRAAGSIPMAWVGMADVALRLGAVDVSRALLEKLANSNAGNTLPSAIWARVFAVVADAALKESRYAVAARCARAGLNVSNLIACKQGIQNGALRARLKETLKRSLETQIARELERI